MIFQTSMIMFHVHLQGCIPNYLESLLVQDVVNQMCQLNDAIAGSPACHDGVMIACDMHCDDASSEHIYGMLCI